MKTITYHKSGSGNTKVNHVIFNENSVSIKSQASLILLNDYLREMDEDYLIRTSELQEYLDKRFLFLIKTKRKEGDLACHYCKKPNLEIGYRNANLSQLNNKNKKLATIDHVIPVSSGLIKILDESNWVVSCKRCNTKKGSKNYDDFVVKNINI